MELLVLVAPTRFAVKAHPANHQAVHSAQHICRQGRSFSSMMRRLLPWCLALTCYRTRRTSMKLTYLFMGRPNRTPNIQGHNQCHWRTKCRAAPNWYLSCKRGRSRCPAVQPQNGQALQGYQEDQTRHLRLGGLPPENCSSKGRRAGKYQQRQQPEAVLIPWM